MKLTFSHLGSERTLSKHPKVEQALKKGTLTEIAAKTRPWYLRFTAAGKMRSFKLPATDKDAIRAAKDILTSHRDQPSQFHAFVASLEARRGLTIGQLAEEWRPLHLPDADGHPRGADAEAHLEEYLTSALRWWSTKPAQSITRAHMLDYATWRRSVATKGTGDRSIDLELTALSSLCQWAKAAQKIAANPFEDRPRFRRPEDVTHCHDAMPTSDEQFHAILTQFWTIPLFSPPETATVAQKADQLAEHTHLSRQKIVAGAWLCWCALSGLRPGEPVYLVRHAALQQPPANPRGLAAGTMFPTRDAKQVMKVDRLKHGQNPYVTIHPVAQDFIDTWQAWLNTNLPAAVHWFPNPDDLTRPLVEESDTSLINEQLTAACIAAGAQPCKPHGFGRAYYVRVRRSAGADDSTIANELGQTTNGKLIRTTYGDPDDMLGGAAFDWLPDSTEPAWRLLTAQAQSNIIALHQQSHP